MVKKDKVTTSLQFTSKVPSKKQPRQRAGQRKNRPEQSYKPKGTKAKLIRLFNQSQTVSKPIKNTLVV